MISENFFTVIIPTFNRKRYLIEAVNSVLRQSFKSWDLHIVDNSSTDGTAEYLKKISRDKRIKFTIINNDGIIAKSRNYALRRVKTLAVSFLDDDDIWLPNKLKDDFELLNSGYSLVYSKTAVFCTGCSPYRNLPVRNLGLNPTRNMLIFGNTFITSSVSYLYENGFKNKLFNESRDFLTWEDYDLWIRLLDKGIKPIRNNKISVLYRISNFQNSNVKREIKNLYLIAKHHKKYYEKYNINTFKGHALWSFYSYLISFLKLKKYSLAFYSIFNIFKLSSNLKEYNYFLKSVLKFLFEFLYFKK